MSGQDCCASAQEIHASLRASGRSVGIASVYRVLEVLVLAHETGHRIGAIRQLRWSDIRWSAGVIRWRGGQDKSRFEHETPLR